jgi:RND superfamily putative drug exporter
MNVFGAWGGIVYRFRWPVLALSAILLAASIVGLQFAGVNKNTTPKSLESQKAFELVSRELPRQASGGASFDLIFGSDSLRVQDPAFKQAMLQALQPLRTDPRVKSILTPYDASPDPAAMISKDGRHASAHVAVRDEFATARNYYPELRSKVRSDHLQIATTGYLATNHDFDSYLEGDLHRAEFVSLPLALILLLLVFGTVVAALLPLGVGGLAVVGGLAAVGLLARVTDVSTYAANIVTLVGLGVAIDYSLFIVNRFREELHAGRSVADSLQVAMATSGRAITFSGLTVAIGLSGMLFFQGSFLASMGLGGAIVVGIAVFYALTFLPALLAVLGPRVERLRLPARHAARAGSRAKDVQRGLWHRVATWVMRRPVLTLVPVLALLALLASPFLQLRIANGDITQLPPNAESRKGYALMQQFPGQGKTYLTVVLDYGNASPLTREHIGALYDYVQRLKGLRGVEAVESPVTVDPRLSRAQYQAILSGPASGQPPQLREFVQSSVGPHVAVLSLVSASAPESDTVRAIVSDLRQNISPPADSRVLVGAFDIDFTDFIVNRLPYAIAFVMAVTYLVLFLLTGSLVLPLKAVIMNVISISASFGALVFIFQQGHLASVLNFTPGAIDPSVPVLLFCTVFGLSMDYEVLLISRIQEEYRRTGNTRAAVAEGMERSGRLITGAAAIMVAVFGAFALANVLVIKSIGLGLAIAVALDATLVRALIVPAVMRLLGRINWWSPRPLARLHRRVSLGDPGFSPRPAPATE